MEGLGKDIYEGQKKLRETVERVKLTGLILYVQTVEDTQPVERMDTDQRKVAQ